MSKDFKRHSRATTDMPEITSSAQFIELQQRFLGAMPDQTVTIEQLIAEGDRVAAYATYSGTQTGAMAEAPATGQSVSLPFLAMFRIDGDKIDEMWVEWDNITFLSQLGLFPPPCPE